MQHRPIQNRDFIFFSSQPWEADLGSNYKDMAFELARNNRVLFVNRALDRFSLLKDKRKPEFAPRLASLQDRQNAPREVHPGLWLFNPATVIESINWIPVAAVHDLVNRLNNKRLAREINKASAQLCFESPILVNDNDFIRGRYLKQLVNCSFYVFYKRDDMLAINYFQRHGPRLQAGLLAEVDLVATNSAYLARLASAYNANTVDIGQGCDLRLFQPGKRELPGPLHNIAKPIIGYTGYVSAWRIDVSIIKLLAEEVPHGNIVLIGPVDPLFKSDQLKGLANVHFVGAKPLAELPAYIEHFDVCINPQTLNNTTIGNYPRKIDEYLAMGKPVVATETETMNMFRPFVRLCKTPEAFVDAVKDLLGSPATYMTADAKQLRRQFAATHTWEASMERFGEACHQTLLTLPIEQKEPLGQGLSPRQQHLAALLFVAAYLLFVYVKFIFF